MATPIQFSDLIQSGRVSAPDPNLPRVFLTYNADFSAAADLELNLVTINQGAAFGVVRSIFIDNGSNPSNVEIWVSGTDQYFTVPPYAQGQFTVSANMQSTIRLTTDGGAVDTVTIAFYNHDIAPSVWYSYGPTNIAEPQKVYGPMTPGDTVATETTNTPVFIGAIDGTGVFRSILCDATGKLEMAGTISISSIIIADGNDEAMGAKSDAAITNPALTASLIALTKGNLTGINTFNTNLGAIADAAVWTGANGSVIAQLKGISSNLNGTGATTSATQTNPAGNASLVGYIRGILTANNLTNTNLGTTNTNLGAVADAAVTNPASSASVIAALKGILTGINSLFSWRTSATGTQSIVAAAAADTSILASNANRKGATIYNDSTAVMYLLVGSGAASTTVYTAQLVGGAYYEVPFGYTGQIRGYWATATGNARITEFS